MPLHLLISHFPIALLVVGAAVDVWGAIAGSESARRTGGGLLMGGSLAAVLAFLTGGDALAQLMARSPAGGPAVDAHVQWGGAGVWLLAGAGMIRALWRDRTRSPYSWITLAAGVASAVLVVVISLSGTALAHAR